MRNVWKILAAMCLALLLGGCGGVATSVKQQDSSKADSSAAPSSSKAKYHENVSDVLLDSKPLTGTDLEMAKQLVHKREMITDLTRSLVLADNPSPSVTQLSAKYNVGLFPAQDDRLEAVLIGPPSTVDAWDEARSLKDADTAEDDAALAALVNFSGDRAAALSAIKPLLLKRISAAKEVAVQISTQAKNPDLAQAGVENAAALDKVKADVDAADFG